jgi:hypothetical protein
MVTIVQTCPAPDCVGAVRYTSHGGLTASIRGSCGDCGRLYRLVSGLPSEIDRKVRRPRRGRHPRRGAA